MVQGQDGHKETQGPGPEGCKKLRGVGRLPLNYASRPGSCPRARSSHGDRCPVYPRADLESRPDQTRGLHERRPELLFTHVRPTRNTRPAPEGAVEPPRGRLLHRARRRRAGHAGGGLRVRRLVNLYPDAIGRSRDVLNVPATSSSVKYA